MQKKRAVNKTKEISCHGSNMAVLNSQIKDYQTLCRLKLHLILHFAYLTGSNVSLAVDFYFQCTPLTYSKVETKNRTSLGKVCTFSFNKMKTTTTTKTKQWTWYAPLALSGGGEGCRLSCFKLWFRWGLKMVFFFAERGGRFVRWEDLTYLEKLIYFLSSPNNLYNFHPTPTRQFIKTD